MGDMKRTIFICLVILFLSQTAWTQEKCQAPVLNVGDKWTYKSATGKTWTNEVVEIKEDVFILKLGASRNLNAYDRKTMNHKYVLEEGGKQVESEDARRKLWDFPLQVGKKWTDITYHYPLTDTRRTGGKALFNEDFKIEGIEEVVTAAGTFKAYKIYFEHTNRKNNQGGWIRYWYSPEAKAWVKSKVGKSYSWRANPWAQDAELISYELK